jgi:hypothetical protein
MGCMARLSLPRETRAFPPAPRDEPKSALTFVHQLRGQEPSKQVGPVPRLALGRWRGKGLMGFHCDRRWNIVAGDGPHASLREAKQNAERFIRGIGSVEADRLHEGASRSLHRSNGSNVRDVLEAVARCREDGRDDPHLGLERTGGEAPGDRTRAPRVKTHPSERRVSWCALSD